MTALPAVHPFHKKMMVDKVSTVSASVAPIFQEKVSDVVDGKVRQSSMQPLKHATPAEPRTAIFRPWHLPVEPSSAIAFRP